MLSTNQTEPIQLLEWSLGAIQIFIGVGATAAGAVLVIDPSGAALQFELDALLDTPFSSYLIPGLVLFAVNGVGNLLGARATLRRTPFAGLLGMALGLFLVGWIVAQVYWLGLVTWLQPTYFILGIVELILGLVVYRRAPR